MSNPGLIEQQMQEIEDELSATIDEWENCHRESAETERLYKQEKAVVKKKLEMDGIRATLIGDYAEGDPKVAEKRYLWQIAEGREKACKERIELLKKKHDKQRSLYSFRRAEFERS